MTEAATLRRFACHLLMVMTIGWMTARILAVENVIEPSLNKRYDRKFPPANPEPSPTFSSNDRARWATVRALVDRGTFVIGKRIADEKAPKGYRDEGILFEEGYRTIDVVLNPETHEFFGTKPPLLTALVAGEYWVIKKVTGWDIDKQRWQVVCTILVSLNVLPLLLYLIFFGRLIEPLTASDSAKLFAFAAACLGTFLTTFSNTLNNHTPAAFCIMFSLYPWLKNRSEGQRVSPSTVLLSGLLAGLASSMDLPALAFGGLLAFFIGIQSRGQAMLFTIGVSIPMVAQLGINYLAIGEWMPIYLKFNDPDAMRWYRFDGSHWEKLNWKENGLPKPAGIDFADEPKGIYAFHLLLGHHGWFSLTPIFLISLIGMVKRINFASGANAVGKRLPILTVVVAAVVIAFYIRTSNNYGGFSSGPRWLFWLTPLFLLHLPAGYAVLEKWKWGRVLAMGCLAVSVFSASFPVMNPWRHPWAMQVLDFYDWLRY